MTSTSTTTSHRFAGPGTAYEPVETPSGDRVRTNTDDDRLAELDAAARGRVDAMRNASPADLTERIEALEQESDIERLLEVNASILSLTGLVLGIAVNRRFLILPAIVVGFLLQHGLSGWCPPLPIMRRFGVRSRQEIDGEKYVLKAMRGDFAGLSAAR